MLKRFSVSSIVVLLLSVLISIVASADFSGPGTSGTADSASPFTELQPGKGRSLEPKQLPEAVKSLVDSKKRTSVRLADDSLELDIPARTFSKSTDISITPLPAPRGGGVNVFQKWDLRAVDPTDKTELHRFNKEITLRSKFDPDDIRGMDWNSLTFVWFNPKTNAWEPISTEVDFESRTMTAKTDHFSIYGSQAASAYALPGQIMDFQVNLNSGSATYSYPIQLPPGRGGFQPLNLAFNYNSGSVDEMKNKRDVGSMAGIGWSFELPHIFYNEEKDQYSLVLGGVGGELVQDGTTSRWHTNPDQGIHIERTTSGSDKWEIRTKDGTLYTFDTQRSYWSAPCTGSAITYRWDLDSVVDQRDNTIEITWEQDKLDHSQGTCESVRAAYPSAVTAVDGATDLWIADFEYKSTSDNNYFADSNYSHVSPSADRIRRDVPRHYTSKPEPVIAETRVLNAISVEDDSGNVIRKYELGVTTTAASDQGATYGWYAGEHKLNSITLRGAGSGAGTLPATSFTYASKQIYMWDSDALESSGNPGNPFSYNRPYLAAVDNGFGASVDFEYTQKPPQPVSQTWTRQIVTRVTSDPDPNVEIDGVETDTIYQYLDESGNDADPLYVGTPTTMWLREYRGFGLVKVTSSDGSYSLNRYFTDGTSATVSHPIAGSVNEDAEKLRGRQYEQELFDSDGVRLSRSVTNWDWSWVDQSDGIYEVSIGDSGSQTFDAVGTTENSKSWTYFGYDTYGNTVLERRLGNYALTDDDVTVHRDFVYNNSASEWIVNTAKNERLYSGDLITDPEDSPDNVAEVKLGETRYSYDGLSYGTAPTRGEVTTVEVFSAPGVSQSTTTTYDSYGNVASITDPRNEITSFAYDTMLHAYVATTTLPQVGTASAMTVQSSYDLTADTGSPNLPAGILRGLKESDTDENDNSTSYKYDRFGRITEISLPGDGTNPSQRFSYEDWGTAGDQRIETEAKIDDSPVTYLKRQEFFDGFGRVVQAHEPSGTSGKTLIVGAVLFDSMGRATTQYTPWEVTGTPGTYQTPLSTTATGTSEESVGNGMNVDSGGAAWANPGNVTSADNSRSAFSGTGLVTTDSGWRRGHDTTNVDYQEGASWGAGDSILNYDLGHSISVMPTGWAAPSCQCNPWSDYLVVGFQDFGLSFDTDINGFETRVRYSQDIYESDIAGYVWMSKNDAPTGSSKSYGTDFTTTWSTSTQGSSTDLWGTTWTASDLEATGFGVVFRADSGYNSGNSWSYPQLDFAELKVHYDAPAVSDYLEATGLGLDIPSGSQIDGIEVKIERSAETSTPVVRDEVAQLIAPTGPIGDNKADTTTNWPTTDTVKTYGGSTDTWGRDWTAAEINSDKFGVRLQVRTKSLDDARVDHIQIKVYYTEPIDDVFASSNVHDALGRVVEETGVDGAKITRSYAAASASGELWEETVTDPLVNKVRNYTDAFGRLVRIVEENGSGQDYRETRYTYNAAGNLTKVEVDPIEDSTLPTVVTEMTYDWLGRKLTHRDPDVGFWRYTYDANGNLITQTDARGVELTFTYDELNRETKRECTGNCPGGTTPVTLATFGYDDDTNGNEGLGRRTSAYNGGLPSSYTVSDEFVYDARGRVIDQTRTVQGVEYATTYSYDPADRLLTTTLPNGEVVSQTYDNRGLPNDLLSSVVGDLVSTSGYNLLDLPTAIGLGNGTTNSREYFGLEHIVPGQPTKNFGQLYRNRVTGSTAAPTVPSYDQAVLDRNPIGYWRLNESSGTTAADSSTSNNDGTYVGTPTLGATGLLVGDSDKAVAFDTAGEKVNVSPHPDISNGFTISMLASWDGSNPTEGGRVASSTIFKFSRLGSGEWQIQVRRSSWPWAGVTSDDQMIAGQTYHLAATWDGSTLLLYVDGVKQMETEAVSDLWSIPGSFDISHSNSSLDFSGTVDEVAFFDYALGLSDIQALYNASLGLSNGSGQVGAPADYTFDWDLNGNLTSRIDSANSVTESFTYDFLNRLTGVTNAYARTYAYDGHDNIASKTDLGVYAYDLSGVMPDTSAPFIDEAAHYWSFNSADISGDSIDDLVGAADGTIEPDAGTGPQVVAGLLGDALNFDGTAQDYVSLPHDVVDGKSALTISQWVKTSDTGVQTLLSGARSGTLSEIVVQIDNNDAVRFHANNSYVDWLDLPSIADGTWHHIVVVRDDASNLATLYLDGLSYGTVPLTMGLIDIDANGLVFGQRHQGSVGSFGSGQEFNGLLDDLRIYHRVLAPGEVTALYYTGSAPDRPHLVTGTTSSGTDAYAYDANGNTTARPGQNLTWNAENLLEKVSDSGTSATIETYIYDADGQRAIKTSGSGDVTHYVSGQYQVENPAPRIELVSNTSAADDNVTSQSVTGNWQAGNKLVITGVFNYIADNPVLSDNGPGLTYVLEQSDQVSPNQRLVVWTADVTSGGLFDITLTVDTANNMGIGVLELSGAATGSAEASYADYKSGNVKNISATLTTLTDGAWVISSMGTHSRFDEAHDPVGYTFVHSFGNPAVQRQWAHVSYEEYATAGNADHTWDWGSYSADTGIIALSIAPADPQPRQTVTYFHGGQVVASSSVTAITIASSTVSAHVADENTTGDGFGMAMALDGDTLFVGAGDDDDEANNAGAVYVFSNAGGSWTQTQKLVSPTAEANGRFGGETKTIAADGGVLAIGAFLEDVGTNADEGQVHLFEWNGTSWVFDTTINSPAGSATDQFGRYIAIDGDTLVIAAANEDIGPSTYDEGALHVYEKQSNGTWLHVKQLFASSRATGQRVGERIAIDRDVIVAGNRKYDGSAGNDQGAAYVFEKINGSWQQTETARLTPADADAGDIFGYDVAVSGHTIAVSAVYDDDLGQDAGAVYLFHKAGGQWSEAEKITTADGAAGDGVGWSLALEDDLLAFGAPFWDSPTVNGVGQMYIYQRLNGGWKDVARLTGQSAVLDDSFGVASSLKDGKLAITTKNYDDGANNDVGAYSVRQLRGGRSNIQFLHTDHLGSPVAATDVFGTVVGTAAYYPFGEQRTSTGVFGTERGFTGQIRDAGTGLNFYNARYQDPVLGRFISPDSIVADPANPGLFNRFAYVSNNPLKYTDPTGHAQCEDDPNAVGCGGTSPAAPNNPCSGGSLQHQCLKTPTSPPPTAEPGAPAAPGDSTSPEPEVLPAPPTGEPPIPPSPSEFTAVLINGILSDGERAFDTPNVFVYIDVVVVQFSDPIFLLLAALGKDAIVLNGTVYIVEDKLHDVDLMYHEAVHVLEQRAEGPILWTGRYLTTPSFRENAEARGNEVQRRVRVDQDSGSGTSSLTVTPK